MKPLLFWVGASVDPYLTHRELWRGLAWKAVTVSDNDATAELWSLVGEEQLLALIRDQTGISWRTDGQGEHPSLRVLVTASELAAAFAAFARDDRDVAAELRGWMRDVPVGQTFGVRGEACEVLGVAEGVVGVKCGWFGLERAHAVTLVQFSGRSIGAIVTTFRPPDAASRDALAEARRSAEALVAAHDEFFGASIRSATRHALQVAADL
ncbi:MAG: hypothetical protein M3Q68_00120 [Actinomycetota bacterium]|nr:hypothetical protein [Actinomycetota bacterium]